MSITKNAKLQKEKTMELRNPFGLRGNQIILIEDIPKSENGLRCDCVCPACKEPFEARMGDIRRHHFAHSGQGCDEINAYLTGLYMLLNEYLSSGQPLFLPPVIVSFELSAYYYLTNENITEHTNLISISHDKNHEIFLYNSKTIRFTSSTIVKNSSGRPKAIIAEAHNRQLAIRITPPDTVCKFGTVSQYQDYPTIEIDLSSAADMIQKSQKSTFFKYLMSHHAIYNWIYNPKISKAYPQIIKLSKSYYDAAQARMKKEEEERKARAALQAEEAKKRLVELRQQEEERERIREERLRSHAEELRHKQEENVHKHAEGKTLQEKKSRLTKEERYNIGLSYVRDKFTQHEKIIRDCFKNRWVKCEKCGDIKQDVEFASYGGIGRVNLGICRDCSRKQR